MPDGTSRFYDKNAESLARRYESADVSDLHRRLLDLFPARTKLLEIGSGSGREAAFLLSRDRDVFCVEASPAMADRAEFLHPELSGRIFRGAVPKFFPGFSSPLDGAFAVASLMHLPREAAGRTVDLIHGCLKPGGLFFFSVPLLRPNLDKNGLDPEGRFFLMLEEDEWTAMLTTAGFEMKDFSRTADSLGRKQVVWGNWVGEKVF